MTGVTENGILDKQEFEDYRARTVRYRFANQLLLGIGGATVFGLVGAVGESLFKVGVLPSIMGLGAAGTAVAIAGLAALAVIGIGCIYLGSRYLTKNVILDQDFQAKKIGMATRGPGQDIGVTAQPTIPPSVPTGMSTAEKTETAEIASENPPSISWASQHAPRAEAIAARRAAEPKWADRLATNDAAPALERSA